MKKSPKPLNKIGPLSHNNKLLNKIRAVSIKSYKNSKDSLPSLDISN